MKRREFIALCGLGWASTSALAQGVERAAGGSCRIIVGFPPGGSTDVIARRLGDRLRGAYAASVVVDNRPGAGGRIAVERLRTSATDGTVMILTPHPMMTVYPHVYKSLPYDALADFAPVTSVCLTAAALSVGPAVPRTVRTPADFVGWCRQHPDRATYGSAGEGTTPHLIGYLFGRAAGIRYLHVPFQGGAPVVTSILGGQIAASVNPLVEVIAHHLGGTLRVLATTGPARSRFLPDVPTFGEAGFREVDTPIEWFGVFVPAGTATPVVERLNAAVRAAVERLATSGEFDELALDPAGETVEDFRRRVAADHARWGMLVRAAGFKLSE